jgi:hypothetical protein
MRNKMNKIDKEQMDEILIEIDEERIKEGKPPLSMMVRHDDGAMSTAFQGYQ